MWVKSQGGKLINFDLIISVSYDSIEDVTWVNTRYGGYDIAEGNYIPVLAEALMRGTTYLEVRNHE